ncbi:hypothetical protein GCM10010515_59600 [Streptomyces fructofermentans]|uniref:Uncharacterized protein n=1 Tax=Streptomyces fructofermentans TaxID=152141 RepID=A0A918NNX8_9ACTN|nr:hypothetical protein GCM10010515_59600 [Streptomyces fructofermentans]
MEPGEDGDRFDCTATELISGMLTDPRHPYTIPADYTTHWFVPEGSPYRQAPPGF